MWAILGVRGMIREAFNHKPALVFWELTRACDLVCKHCRAQAQPKCDPLELKKEEGNRLIDEIAGWNGPMLIMTGGDPLKHPCFWDWLAYAKKKGVKVSVTPSPTPLVTQEALRRIKRLGVNRIGISLDGSTPFAHDSFRGVTGSYYRVLQIARHAEKIKLPLQINTTLTHHNRHQLVPMGRLAKRLGAKMWSLFFLVPIGRGKKIELFTPQEHEAIFKQLIDIKEKYQLPIKTTEAPHYRRFVLQQQKKADFRGRGTGDGRGVVFVSRIGDIYPSGFLPLKSGNVRENSLSEVYVSSPLFKSLRDPTRFKGKCGVCPYHFVCGGSRARAYAFSGDPIESDPTCSYQPDNVLNSLYGN